MIRVACIVLPSQLEHRMKSPFELRRLPTRAERLRSEIAQLEARYDSGAMPRSIYELLKRMRAELVRRTAESK
jgi:hypothetical protein